MLRFFAGAAAAFLLLTGAFLLWQGRAEQRSGLLPAPRTQGSATPSLFAASTPLEAPEASAKSREEKRFSRADTNKDGKIEGDEIFAARHKAFAKLDINANGSLSFEEWAAKTIDKFQTADKDHNGWLSAAEYSTTAPPPPKHKSCSCGPAQPEAASEDTGQ